MSEINLVYDDDLLRAVEWSGASSDSDHLYLGDGVKEGVWSGGAVPTELVEEICEKLEAGGYRVETNKSRQPGKTRIDLTKKSNR
jgi:hypothetical protein